MNPGDKKQRPFRTKRRKIQHLKLIAVNKLLKNNFNENHSDSPIFECDISGCKARFCSMFSLRFHYAKSHYSKKNFRCIFCTRIFISKRRRDKHEATHTNEKSLSCFYCAAKFESQNHITNHRETCQKYLERTNEYD